MINIIIGPNPPEPEQKATFDEIKQDIERQTWIGRSTRLQTPGGGNNPKEHED